MKFSEKLIELLSNDARTVVLTGAGVSAESGVPTFRGGSDSLWEKFDPRELASVNAFMANPKLVWEWYQWRRKLIRDVKPNAGHLTLVKMQRRLSCFSLITQNVDNLHQLAGAENVTELHGNILRNKCFVCGQFVAEMEHLSDELCKCSCGGTIRPDVVWFGEMLPQAEIESAMNDARQAELFLSVGTSAEVFPAADLPILAKRSGAYLVEINPDETRLSAHADEVLRAASGEALPKLWEAVEIRSRVFETEANQNVE